MPTYEYECPSCDTTFERFQSITAKRVRTCPECGGRRVRRLIGAGAGIIFRGSGFYETDYRSDAYKREAKAESTSSSSSSSDSTGSDSKSKTDSTKGSKKKSTSTTK
ncbi:zinc ribbon domain-containing protein [bacterium]|nr:zinc ribbon domain-containing protein [bacterium]